MNTHTKDLWRQVTSFDALHAAWARVDTNAGSQGGDGVHRGEFRSDLFGRLNALRADLLSGAYTSRPFRKVSIPKKKPGYRILTIPSIRDRIVHTSLSLALSPILEPTFEDSSFGYRPGRGVQDAVARIERWRDRGYSFVIEADIVRYFDNIAHDLLMDKLDAHIADGPGAEAVRGLIKRILIDQAKALSSPNRGLVQGSPLSPLLANLYLDALDEEIEAQGVKIVRFADDFVILCKSQRKAEKVMAHCVAVLQAHGLALHEDGTRIVNFDRGFDFIGYLFTRSLALKENKSPQLTPRKKVKSEVTDDGVIVLDNDGSRLDQNGRVLYVLDPDHKLRVRNKSFSVQRDDGTELIALSHRRIRRIEVGTDVDYDRNCIDLALSSHVDWALIDHFGQTKGHLSGARNPRAGRQFRQAAAVLDTKFRLSIARALVLMRIRNQRAQLSRLNRKQKIKAVTDAFNRLRASIPAVEAACTIDELRGFEGHATATYWKALGLLFTRAEDRTFNRERPAKTPENAAINYLTGILERDVRAATQAAHLHTGFAFLHGTRDRHDGLVFDMMEPYRAPLSEGLAVFLFSARRLRREMFVETQQDRIEILTEGRKALITGYENAVSSKLSNPNGNGKIGWRSVMLNQTRSLGKAIDEKNVECFLNVLLEPNAA